MENRQMELLSEIKQSLLDLLTKIEELEKAADITAEAVADDPVPVIEELENQEEDFAAPFEIDLDIDMPVKAVEEPVAEPEEPVVESAPAAEPEVAPAPEESFAELEVEASPEEPFEEPEDASAPEPVAAPEPEPEVEPEPEAAPVPEEPFAEPEPEPEPFAEPAFVAAPAAAPAEPVESVNDAERSRLKLAVNEALSVTHAWKTDKPGPRVNNILSAISLNDRMNYIRVLFNGNPVLFQQTISSFNRFSTLDEAVEMITESFPQWDMDSKTVYSFMMSVRRRLG